MSERLATIQGGGHGGCCHAAGGGKQLRLTTLVQSKVSELVRLQGEHKPSTKHPRQSHNKAFAEAHALMYKLELTIEGQGQTLEQLKAELETYRSPLTAQQQQLESHPLDATALEHSKTRHCRSCLARRQPCGASTRVS